MTDKYELLITQFEQSQAKLSSATSQFEVIQSQIVEQHQLLQETSLAAKRAKIEHDEWREKLVQLELEYEEKHDAKEEMAIKNQDLIALAEMTDNAKMAYADASDKLNLAQNELSKITVELEARQNELNKKNSQLLEVQNKLRESLQGI